MVPAIHAKIRIANERLASILQPGLDLRDPAVLTDFVMAYLFFAAVFEGCWFFNGFSPIFALQRRGLMKGTAEQLQYIMRDEVLHSGFGIRVVRQILQEESLTLDPDALAAMWQQAEAAEIAYAGICCRSRSWATAPSCMSRSSATSPTDARTSCASRTLCRRRGGPALAGRAGQPAQGEELLRDPGDGVSGRRRAALGMRLLPARVGAGGRSVPMPYCAD